ncbi:MAG: hypothetical protein K1X86_05325 [Ignavibacteria bacterium]|nr:hypothetical protein [Ignavibacteria bacterium]
MKSLYVILALSLTFLAGILHAQDEKEINFQVSTNLYYLPGEDVQAYVYSYDYSEKNSKKQNFEFKVYKIKDLGAFYSKQLSRYGVDVLGADSTNLLYYCSEYANFEKSLSSKNDYGYRYINEYVKLSVYDKGAYLLRVKAGNKVAYCGFIISSAGVISKAGNNSMLAYTVDRKTGVPISNANLDFYLGDKKIGHGTTADGLFYQTITNEVKQSGNEDRMTPLIVGNAGDDIIISDVYLYFGYGASQYYSYVYTEQPVYRTGSLVNFKGTLRETSENDFKTVPNREITVIIRDAKNAEVYKQVLKTNENGSYNGSFKVDDEGALGTYYIQTQIDQKHTYTATFEVEQYKKPEYKVSVKLDKSQYYGRDEMKASVQADYYFGSPVADAEVEYNVFKIRYYKPWWRFSEWAWWYEDFYAEQENNYSGSEMIYSGTGKLNKDGKFDFEYAIKEDFKSENNRDYYYRYWYGGEESDYRYIVQAKVTDKSRRQINGTSTAFVTRGGFTLTANPDKYWYKKNDKVNFTVNAEDFASKPVKTSFEVSIYRQNYYYYDYKESSKDFIGSVKGETRNDGKGIAEFTLPFDAKNGYYFAEVKAIDDRSNVIKTSTSFYVSDGDYSWYNNESGAVQIITDKDNYKNGEICNAVIFTTVPDANVLITTEDDNIISYQTKRFVGKSDAVQIPVTDKYKTNFKISVSYVSNGNLFTESKNILVVPEEKFLTVSIDPSKLVYKPRESGEVKVKVTDKFGNAVKNAEVSLGVVDESIYAIKEDKTKDIRKYFYGQKPYYVSTAFMSYNSSYGTSRLITIYERFNVKSTSENDLATIKGIVVTPDSMAVSGATIVIDNDFQAAVTDENGIFEFKLPEGSYKIGLYRDKKSDGTNNIMEITLSKGKTLNLLLNAGMKTKDGKDIEQSGKIITQQEIENSGIRGITQLISQSGDFVQDERGEQTNFKGGRTSESSIIVDGVTTTKPVTEDKEKYTEEPKQKKDVSKTEEKMVTPEVRSDFKDAINWTPYAKTDENGYAVVYVTYPDNLTAWRMSSRVITEDTKVGQAANTVITRKDLLVRMETPRFLQDGDIVTISTMVHNYLSTEKNVKVKFRAGNTELQGDSTKELKLASNSEQRIDWTIKVNNPYGIAKLYAEALTNEESDAVEMSVPLQPRGLQMMVPTVADFDDLYKNEVKSVYIPGGTDLRSVTMKFAVAPSLASTMLSALDELAGYPYGCVEQTMSRFLPTVVVAGAFQDLGAPISDALKKDLPKMVEAGVNRLYGFQHSDGGWGWWTNDNSNNFMSAYVIYGFKMAKDANYKVKENVLKKGITYVKGRVSSEADPTTKAYMLYVISLVDDKDKEKMKNEIENLLSNAEINDYARSLCALAMKNYGENNRAEMILAILEQNVKSAGEGAAYWEGKTWHYNWQQDKVQTTAMALKAFVNIKTGSDLKDKIIRWLMMQRQGTSWRNTQETAWVIYAMVDYLKNSNELNPDYSVSVFVNGKQYLTKQMTRDDVFKKDALIKLDGSAMQQGNNEIRIEKSGAGKVYFSSNTTYYTTDMDARENGFRVEREYYKLEKYNSYNEDKITYRKKYFDALLKSGDEVLVKIKVYSKDENLSYFMLEDPIPAGCEVIKDDWAYQIEDEKDYSGGYSYYWWRWWYADKDVRDNRVTFFATNLWSKEYEYSYIMRAQIPGEYTVNPTRGSLMYYTDVNGNAQGFKLRIEDK